jgi:hypothetical protein
MIVLESGESLMTSLGILTCKSEIIFRPLVIYVIQHAMIGHIKAARVTQKLQKEKLKNKSIK